MAIFHNRYIITLFAIIYNSCPTTQAFQNVLKLFQNLISFNLRLCI